jgi:hypothetical protein
MHMLIAVLIDVSPSFVPVQVLVPGSQLQSQGELRKLFLDRCFTQ